MAHGAAHVASEEDRERYEVVRFITEIAGKLQEPTLEPHEVDGDVVKEGIPHGGDVSGNELNSDAIDPYENHGDGSSADAIDPAGGLTRIEVTDLFNEIISDLDTSQDQPIS